MTPSTKWESDVGLAPRATCPFYINELLDMSPCGALGKGDDGEV